MLAKNIKRNNTLDVLRALAIFLVLGRHMKTCPPEVNSYLSVFTEVWQRVGWIGVDLFFVLSGFLVSSLLFREKLVHNQIIIRRFLIRRGFKLYPSFWIFIGFTVLYRHLYLGYPLYLDSLFGELLFLQNYIGNLWGYTWSLAVEEHFYILLALLLVWLARRDSVNQHKTPFVELPQISIIVFIVCLILRFITACYTLNSDSYDLLFPTHLRIDSLMFGVFLSWVWHFKAKVKQRIISQSWWLVVLGLFLVFLLFLVNLDRTISMFTIGLTLLYFGFGILIIGAIDFELKDGILLRCLTAVGYYSYSIYLWHGPVQLWLVPSLGKNISSVFISNWYVYFLSYFLGSIIIGCLASNLFEKPFLYLRDKLFPSRTQPLRF